MGDVGDSIAALRDAVVARSTSDRPDRDSYAPTRRRAVLPIRCHYYSCPLDRCCRTATSVRVCGTPASYEHTHAVNTAMISMIVIHEKPMHNADRPPIADNNDGTCTRYLFRLMSA